MHKLCLPVLTLALSAPLLVSAAEPPAATASASASVSAKVTVTDQDALNDDILATIDLPLAAAEARDAGVEEADLKEALDTSREAGLPASEATEVVAVEAEQTRTRGVKKGFGRWVRMQVAAGHRGKKLADKIKQRKEETKELDPKQLEDLKAKLQTQAETNRAWKVKWAEKRRDLLAKGKSPVIGHKDRHDKLSAKIDKREDKLDAKQDEATTRLRELEVKLSTASDADKPALEAEKQRLEKKLGKLEKREDRLDKFEDKLSDKPGKAGGPIPRPGIPDKKGEGTGTAETKTAKPHHPGKAADKKAPEAKKPEGSAAQ